MKAISLPVVIALSVAALSAGCVISPIGPGGPLGPGGPRYVDEGHVVGTAPPPAQYEVVGVPPVVGMVWLGGYWGWASGRYVWHRGYWAHGRPGHHWVPHSWAPTRGGWTHRPGHWRRG